MRIAVLTAITNKRDDCHMVNLNDGCDYHVFSSDPMDIKEGVQLHRIEHELSSPVLTAKQYKILPHLMLPGYDAYVWIDGSFEPTQSITGIVEHTRTIAAYRHPFHKTIDQEAEVCRRMKLDLPDNIDRLLETHKRRNVYYKELPLYACGILVIINSEAVETMLAKWWLYVTMFSTRDQLSFPVATNCDINTIDGDIFDSEYFKYHNHNK